MLKVRLFATTFLLGVALVMADGSANAQSTQSGRGTASGARGMMYGSQLMTPAERNEYRKRMLAAKSDAERQKIRDQHHAEMQKRAKARGVTLPEVPPYMQGMHRGQGMGMGSGMGPGYMHGQPGGPGNGAASQ
ncbi:hypothetical protein GWC77_26730 [Paraburkholderia sp. NMBU_R16]|uniref:hypothetical protein n=1 Tax=Paraburkholderia sp. NMBU_R16 TaxID=2698676 RepID=UPI00156458B0|nr:hypothetical protein [Paraburkholderia sp. NMBU_R16]NRO99476.1 hypothetical protein [Paraburkholderia sp. NMBU_R16]